MVHGVAGEMSRRYAVGAQDPVRNNKLAAWLKARMQVCARRLCLGTLRHGSLHLLLNCSAGRMLWPSRTLPASARQQVRGTHDCLAAACCAHAAFVAILEQTLANMQEAHATHGLALEQAAASLPATVSEPLQVMMR